MSSQVAKDAGGRGTWKVGIDMKCLLDLTCLYGMENFRLFPVR